MTRQELVLEVGRLLGDESPSFLTDVDKTFDWVLRDLAQHEAISLLRKTSAAFVVADAVTQYDTRTITGMVAPNYPILIEQLLVPDWGFASPIPMLNDLEFELRVSGASQLSTGGQWTGWRIYPNESTLEVVPAAAGDAVGANAYVVYIAPPTILGDTDEIEEIRPEHLETVVLGMRARLAEMKEETAGDEKLWPLYFEGRARMWGTRFNGRPGRVQPYPF